MSNYFKDRAEMTLQEIESKYAMGEFRFPRKGESFMQSNTFERCAAPRYAVAVAKKTWKYVAAQILIPKISE